MPEKSAAASAERYREAGVAAVNEQPGFASLIDQLRQTFGAGARRPLLDFGHFANVLDVGGPQAIAISTDGVGTKAIVAQMLDKYDTVGIDCVAMNVNDIICVGAEPIAMVDYIAIEAADDRLLSEIGKGLVEGARQANIVVPGGEISQIPQIIRSERPGFGFDLVGTCIGTVDRDRLITGATIEPGDVIVGLASSGIHSNGFTLARKALFDGGRFRPDQHVGELGRSLGEELLEPTRIYVPEVMPMLREGPAHQGARAQHQRRTSEPGAGLDRDRLRHRMAAGTAAHLLADPGGRAACRTARCTSCTTWASASA